MVVLQCAFVSILFKTVALGVLVFFGGGISEGEKIILLTIIYTCTITELSIHNRNIYIKVYNY